MSLDMFWVNLILLIVAIAVAYFLHQKTIRINARFNLYRVRDKFILLTADDVPLLDEDSDLFKHYYNRVNLMLQDDHPMGLDDMVQLVFYKFNNDDFENVLKKAKRRAQKLSENPITQNPAVRDAISDYYSAVESLMLAHSSYLRVLWILSKRMAGVTLSRFVVALFSSQVHRGLKTIDYVETEAKVFQVA